MNFFEAKIVKDGGKLFIDGETFKVEIPSDKTGLYEKHAGKPVTFGIRPEDIHNPDFTPPGITPAKVPAKVEVTELMGNEINAFFVSGKHDFIGRVDPRSKYSFGDDVEVVFNMGNFHIFDKDSGEAIR
jgi:multiple sugar transport system ATP-binding protein